jgi:hypothetical protein
MTQEQMERIDAYLRREMSAAEHSKFEAELATDAKLRSAFEAHQHLLAGIELEGARQTLTAVMTLAPARPLWRRVAPYLAVAATVLLLLVFFWPRQEKPEALFAEHFAPAPGLPTTLGETDALRQAEGMVAYKRGEYAQALEQWTPLLQNEAVSDTLRFFAGVAELGRGQAAAAEKQLKLLTQSVASPYQAAARWYLALAYVRQGQWAAARVELRALEGNDTYRAQAKALLEQVGE